MNNLIKVNSSNVYAIGYSDNVIIVQFNNGSIYNYYNTNEKMFDNFLNAPSKGKFVHQVLKRLPYKKIS